MEIHTKEQLETLDNSKLLQLLKYVEEYLSTESSKNYELSEKEMNKGNTIASKKYKKKSNKLGKLADLVFEYKNGF